MAEAESPALSDAFPQMEPVNVLLVDDRPENLLALEAVLECQNVRLVKAQSGEEALSHLLNEDFALILMDVQMPGFDGFQTVKLIKQRARTQHIPIIFLTAIYRDEQNVRHGYSMGAVDYIVKPYEPDILRTKVSVFVDLFQQQERIARQAVEIERQRQLALRQDALIHQLKEVDRLKSDFLNAASHELRTPLTTIIGYSEFLADQIGGPLTADQVEFVHQIQAGSQRLKSLVDDLLDFARLEAGQFDLACEPSDFASLVDETLARVRAQAARADITLSLERPEGPLPVMMDRRRIDQVLLNLLSNALKFTPAGGRVKVVVHRHDDALVVELHDTGIGIAAEHLPHLFEKFFQADPSLTRRQGGAGLGLSLSKAFVEAHGGTIGALSEPARGSTFWFSLPLVRQDAAREAPTAEQRRA